MDQRELVRDKGDGTPDSFVIALVMHLTDPENLMDESRIFKSIVLDWFQIRGSTAEAVQLIAVSDPKYHGAVIDLFEMLHAGEVSLRTVFGRIPFRIALHDPNGTLLSEKELLPNRAKEKEGVLSKLFKKFGRA
ncbi:hypothetical protein QU487_13150 [Crenobacter sp. SG2305]|uniref:hypothetical protein n=1 Tax=Crenobacter oryzisoli TaxID=3056844 RepID=UPI0025AAD048|nr:hypothetical protein [Crenobacter sp. SG2305]MDN0083693.1 hypothetical protein [Crenobacter sp. SG2305]